MYIKLSLNIRTELFCFVLPLLLLLLLHAAYLYFGIVKWQLPGSLALTVSALDGNRGHWDQLLENPDGVTNTQERRMQRHRFNNHGRHRLGLLLSFFRSGD
jgi:hypothetical protein